MAAQLRPLPRRVVLQVALRSLFIQAGFSPEAMQTLGLLYALAPAWRYLFADEALRQEAVRRHLTPFNTHPYAAAALVGGILHYERRYAAGEATPDDVARFKQALMGPLAALGDGFFWLSWRPAAAAMGVALIPLVGVYAPLIFLAVYNAVHFAARVWLFVAGYREGNVVVLKLARLRLPWWGHRLRELSVASVSALGVWVAAHFGFAAGNVGLGVGCLGGGVMAAMLAEKKVPPLFLLYGAAIAAMGAAAIW